MRAVGGKLMLTDSRLEFRAHGFDDALGGTGWAAELGQIRSVGKQNRGFNPLNGSLRERLRVETADGAAELFVLSPLSELLRPHRDRVGLDQVIEPIRGALAGASGT
jgi:hypothetical protein